MIVSDSQGYLYLNFEPCVLSLFQPIAKENRKEEIFSKLVPSQTDNVILVRIPCHNQEIFSILLDSSDRKVCEDVYGLHC